MVRISQENTVNSYELTTYSGNCPTDANPWNPDYSSDENGEYVCTDACDGLKVAARLTGDLVTVHRCNGSLTQRPTYCLANQNTSSDLEVDFEEADSFEFCQPYAATAFRVIQQTHDWLLELQPSFVALSQNIKVTFANTPNGGHYFFHPVPRINLNQSPNDFGPTTTIISHEYGHFVEHMFGLPPAGLFGEDLADVISMLLWDTSCRGYNRLSAQPNSCEIDWDTPNNARYPDMFFEDTKQRLLAQAFWDLRKQLLYCAGDPEQSCSSHGDCGEDGPCVDRKTEELFVDALRCFKTPFYEAVLPILLSVDDDDGDLTSDPPTPNFAAIFDAFVVQHGFPDPLVPVEGDGSVKVGWTGVSGEPIAGEDYLVHYNITPPYVVLQTTEKGGNAVQRWSVGRVLDGQPADLGTITGVWNGNGNNITVRVGRDAERPCRSADVIDIQPQSPGQSPTWSGIDLQLTGQLTGRASCSTNDTTNRTGGRINGLVLANAEKIAAESIGSGSNTAGILDLGTLKSTTLGGIPQGSALRVVGDVTETITIDGDLAGDLIADWDADGDGKFLGSVVIIGDFTATGNICDAEMGASGQLSSRVTIQGSNLGSVCALRGAILPPAPHTAAKNRYLSINPRTNYSRELALKVRLDSMMRCEVDEAIPCDDSGDCTSGDCSEHDDVEDYWWVAEPFDASCQDDEYNYLTDPPNCTGVDFVARLTGEPVSLDWSAYPVLHIADCQIVPTARYAITAYDETAEEESTELLVSTIARPGSKFYGDVVGAHTSNGWTPPQGVVNFTDIQAVIFGMQGVPTAPHRTWVDIFGAHEGSVPDFRIDATDIDLVVDAFTGANWLAGEYNLYPGDCPSTKTAIQPIGSAVAFSLDVSNGFIDPEEPVYVDVFIGSVDDLGAYEVALEVTGGTEGWLILTDITVDTQRSDYVFGTSSSYIAANLAEARVGNVLASGGVSVTGPKYVATFTYQPSEGATGAFEFAVRDSTYSYLNDCDGRRLAVDAGTNEVIGVGVDCFVNGDCDDFNACTTDTCDDGACIYANVSQGASCNDGLFCTAVDQCDGQGTCVGGMLTPCTEGQTCDELNDQCWTLEPE